MLGWGVSNDSQREGRIIKLLSLTKDFPDGSDGKSVCLRSRRPRFDPWVVKILWSRKWQPTPVFLPEKSHGCRSLAGYSPRGPKELNTTEQLKRSLSHVIQTNVCFILTPDPEKIIYDVTLVSHNYDSSEIFFISYSWSTFERIETDSTPACVLCLVAQWRVVSNSSLESNENIFASVSCI